jgi:hypothetical protein
MSDTPEDVSRAIISSFEKVHETMLLQSLSWPRRFALGVTVRVKIRHRREGGIRANFISIHFTSFLSSLFKRSR